MKAMNCVTCSSVKFVGGGEEEEDDIVLSVWESDVCSRDITVFSLLWNSWRPFVAVLKRSADKK